MVAVDAVVVSWARDHDLLRMTRNCIATMRAASRLVKFNVIVVEGASIYNGMYSHVDRVIEYPRTEEFRYNRALNLGAKRGDAEYILFCNNDLHFRANWCELLIGGMQSVGARSGSPISPRFDQQKQYIGKEPQVGCRPGHEMSGWCFLMERSAYNEIGGFASPTTLWRVEYVVAYQLEQAGIKNVLVPSSVVDHLMQRTIRTFNEERRKRDTWGQRPIFNEWVKEQGGGGSWLAHLAW